MNSISRIVPIVCLTLVGACNSGKMERASEVSTDSLRSAVAVDIRQASSTDDARIQADRARAESARADVERDADARHRCKAAASLPQSIDKILAEPKAYVGNDSCAAVLADAVVARFIRSNDKQYLAVLDALSRAADSKSTELLGAAVLDLFRAKPIELVKHLYMLQGDPAATDVGALLITEIQLGRTDEFDNEIHGILDKLEGGSDLSTDQKRFLSRIESQFWVSSR